MEQEEQKIDGELFAHFTVEIPVSHIGMAISGQPNISIWLSGEMSGFQIWVWEFLAHSW